MTTMITEVYDAFMSGGADEAKARAAAEATASNESRFVKTESDLRLLTWITSATFALVASLVAKTFL